MRRATDVTPSNYLENIERFRMTPIRSIGIGAKSSLKASFWRTDIEDSEVSGDPDYGSVMVHLGGGRVWRNAEPTPGERDRYPCSRSRTRAGGSREW